MFCEFAYSSAMQILLAAGSIVCTFLSLYLVAELILSFCEAPVSRMQKLLFAFITGSLLHNMWVYGIFFIGGMASFTPMVSTLVVSPNPIMAFLYYVVAMKVFRLSAVRSMKMMGYVYLFWTLNTTYYQLLTATIFVQTEPRYNYLLDAISVVTMLVLFAIATKILQYYIRKNHAKLRFVDNGFFDRKREFGHFFARTSFMYLIIVIAPMIIANPVASSLTVNLLLAMFILLNLCLDLHIYDKQVISSQTVHISALFKGLEEFRGVKHDFYNILHSYSGYLELGEYERLKDYHATLVGTTSHAGSMLDLAQRTPEHPVLISLLIDKLADAEKAGVNPLISLKCDLHDFYISSIDLCRVLSCLLDNAIEAAAESEEKRIYLTCENKDADSKLIIITNSAGAQVDVDCIQGYGFTSKEGHSGIGLNTVRNTLSKYGNCTFHIQNFDQEFSAYIEFRKK